MVASPIGQAWSLVADRIDPRIDRLVDSHQEAAWRNTISNGLAEMRMTPAVVEAYAGLLLRTESGQPVRPAAHHRLWLELLCDDRIPELLILAPPEAAKTTWIISAWVGCRIGFFPQQPIIVCSATGPIAKKRTLSLRNQTQTISWQSAFRNARRAAGMFWRMEEWSLAPDGVPFPGRIHPSAAAFGVDGSVTGARGRVVACDDIITRVNAKTEYQRNEVKEFLHSTLWPRLMSDQEQLPSQPFMPSRKVVIGTPYHPSDAYADMIESGRWVVCSTPLLGSDLSQLDGLPYYATVSYPDWWPHDTLGEAVVQDDADPYGD